MLGEFLTGDKRNTCSCLNRRTAPSKNIWCCKPLNYCLWLPFFFKVLLTQLGKCGSPRKVRISVAGVAGCLRGSTALEMHPPAPQSLCFPVKETRALLFSKANIPSRNSKLSLCVYTHTNQSKLNVNKQKSDNS